MTWIQTASGLKFPLLDIDPNAIRIEDIAHALSMLCRFNAQCLRFYSVAEHSVHVSFEIRPDLALIGLMHDAAEAYLGDVPGPLKKCLTEFQVIENRLIRAIAAKFGFAMPEDGSDDARELKRTDVQLLIDGKAVIMAPEPEPWPPNAPPVKDRRRIECWSAETAKAKFLARFIPNSSNRKWRHGPPAKYSCKHYLAHLSICDAVPHIERPHTLWAHRHVLYLCRAARRGMMFLCMDQLVNTCRKARIP